MRFVDDEGGRRAVLVAGGKPLGRDGPPDARIDGREVRVAFRLRLDMGDVEPVGERPIAAA